MKEHTENGYFHTITEIAASVHDIEETVSLLSEDDKFCDSDSTYNRVEKQPKFQNNEHFRKIYVIETLHCLLLINYRKLCFLSHSASNISLYTTVHTKGIKYGKKHNNFISMSGCRPSI